MLSPPPRNGLLTILPLLPLLAASLHAAPRYLRATPVEIITNSVWLRSAPRSPLRIVPTSTTEFHSFLQLSRLARHHGVPSNHVESPR